MVVKDCATNDAVQSTVAGDCFQWLTSFTHGYPLQLSQRHTHSLNIMNVPLAKVDSSETIAEKLGRQLKCSSKIQNQWSMTNNKFLTQGRSGISIGHLMLVESNNLVFLWYLACLSYISMGLSATRYSPIHFTVGNS